MYEGACLQQEKTLIIFGERGRVLNEENALE